MAAFADLPPHMVIPPPGALGRGWVDRLAKAECPALTTRRARRAERSGAPHDPILWQQALGANVWDMDGNRYVDFSAGFGAAAVGHRHPCVVDAIKRQSDTLLHALGDLHPSAIKVRLMERLVELSPFQDARVILGLHGADAVEAALKTALLHTGRAGVLAFEGGYHGLSHGPLALCGYSDAFRAPFAEQLNPHVVFAPYPNAAEPVEQAIAAVREAIQASAKPIGAMIVEPILGRGGVQPPPAGFLRALSALCAERGMLLIADEVMTGFGRTGTRFASVEAECVPDLLCLGKALGGGLPSSACVGRAEVMAAWGTPDKEALHTATFLGNPLMAAAALATLDVIDNEDLPACARDTGRYFQQRLQETLTAHTRVREVRGQGLLIGVAFDEPGLSLKVVQKMLVRGYIAVPAGAQADVVSLTPPLHVSRELCDGFVHAMVDVLGELE